MICRRFIILAALCLPLAAESGGKKTQNSIVSFHVEASQGDNPKFIVPAKLGSEHRQYFFQKVPAFNDRDIAWFYPFLSQDGVSYGAAFKLKEPAAVELKNVTLNNQGRLLGLRCADAPLQAVLIDQPLNDGIIVVWEGLQQRHLQDFKKKFPHVDDVQQSTGPEFALPQP